MSPLNYGLTPKMKPVAPKRTALIAAVDVGTDKIACLIARLKPRPPQEVLRRRTHAIEVIGFSHTESRGMKAGTVIDLSEAEEAVRYAVASRRAQREVPGRVGHRLDVVGTDGERSPDRGNSPERGERAPTRTSPGCWPPAAASRSATAASCCIRFPSATSWTMPRACGIRAACWPRGSASPCMWSPPISPPARNLMLAVERCHLVIEALVAGPYVASLATLADDEADLGAAVIDMGAGTTSMAVFADGRFIHADGFALGGRHVTLDIARGLNTSVHDSERIKTLYGSVLAGAADERDMIKVTALGGDEREPSRSVSRAALTRIIKPRVEEILEIVRDRLAGSPFASEPRGRVILTGGACQLTGLPDLAMQHPRSSGPGRPAARDFRSAGSSQGTGLRRRLRPSRLSPGGAARTLRTAPNAATIDSRDRRLHRSGRTMASRKLLTMDHRATRTGRRPGPATLGGRSRPRTQEASHEHQPEDPRHPRTEAADHRLRRRRRRRQRRQQHDQCRAGGRRFRRRQHRRPGADHVAGRAHHPAGRAGRPRDWAPARSPKSAAPPPRR